MDLYAFFWSDVKDILGEDFYRTIPRVTAEEIRFKLEQIAAEKLCDKCRKAIRAEFRKWLLERKVEKDKFRQEQEKLLRRLKP